MDAKEKRIAALEGLFQAALEKIVQLEAEIAILKKHSGNSSKPPSSDIVKPPKPRKDKDRRRKIGTQKGHKAHQRQPFDRFLAKQVRKVRDALKKPYEELLEQLPKESHLCEVKYLAGRTVKKVSC